MSVASHIPSCILVGCTPFPDHGFTKETKGKRRMAHRMEVAFVSNFAAVYTRSDVV